MAESAAGAAWVRPAGLVPVAIALALFVVFLGQVPIIAAGGTTRLVWEWIPSIDVAITLYIDGLSLMFALLISGIGALVLLYSARYLAGHPQFARFALYLTSFMLAMMGLVLADNLITLFVFWELTTFTSYLLIGFGHAEYKSRRNALQALLVTAAGGLALLAGFILIGAAAGTFELSEINRMDGVLREHAMYLPILILVLIGAFTKSAQVPFHFWLPNAMAAPTPVSAYLHSATMVKGGVYLLARMHPSLSGTDIWLWTLTIFGAVTAVFASLMAVKQTDLKQALAYTTLMALGTLVLFLAPSTGYAITAAVTFLFVHSLYKAALFLSVGLIDHATGTRDADILGGLAGFMPVTALAAGLAALSMAGIPPLLGFIAKELAYAGTVELTLAAFALPMALAANALMFAVAGIVALRPFWGPRGAALPRPPREGPWPMLAGPVILGVLGLLFGLAAPWTGATLIEPAVAAILGAPDTGGRVKLWAGFNVAFVLSLVTFAIGVVLYLRHGQLRGALIRAGEAAPSFDRGWDAFLRGFVRVAKWQTRWIQTGVLRHYMAATFATLLAALGTALWLRGGYGVAFDFSGIELKHWVAIALIVLGTVLTLVTSSRVTAIAALGTAGIGIALVFIMFGAPDVAITQLLVETLVVVLVAVAALRMPYLDPDRTRPFRPLDAGLAAGVGGVTAAVMLLVVDQPFDRRLSDFFEAASWPEAFGRNIVNVILVDFRALDTFGEIAVVVIAALGAYALLRGLGVLDPAPTNGDEEEEEGRR